MMKACKCARVWSWKACSTRLQVKGPNHHILPRVLILKPCMWVEKEVWDIFTLCVTSCAGQDMLVFLEESQSGSNHMIMLFLKELKRKMFGHFPTTSLMCYQLFNGMVFHLIIIHSCI